MHLLIISQVLSPREPLGTCPSLPPRFPETSAGARSRESGPTSCPCPLSHAPRLPRGVAAPPSLGAALAAQTADAAPLIFTAAPKSACRDPCPDKGTPMCQKHW